MNLIIIYNIVQRLNNIFYINDEKIYYRKEEWK
jgi:hypothetical protein